MSNTNREDSSPIKFIDNEEKNKENINNINDSIKNNDIDKLIENDTSIFNINENLKNELNDDKNFK